MEQAVISGIQQVGIGVPDVDAGFAWYRQNFGFDLPVFREAAEAPFMTRYTGGVVQARDATLAVNFYGGGGFEIWQYTSRTPEAPAEIPVLGDLGIFAVRLKSRSVLHAYQFLQGRGAEVPVGVSNDPAGKPRFTVKDPYGNLFQVVESAHTFRPGSLPVGGVDGAIMGVSNIERTTAFYADLLGLDTVVYDTQGIFDDFAGLPGGDAEVRRTLITHSKPLGGAFSPLFGPVYVELVQSLDRTPKRIFENRLWGDLGFIHLCFDVVGMEALKAKAQANGTPFTVDSGGLFDMGEAAGRFAYVEDPDGTLIEFVETFKLPLVKKLGWNVDMQKRDPRKPLPGILFTLMGLMRVKDKR